MTTNNRLIDDLEAISRNPSGVQRRVLDFVEQAYMGEVEIANPLSPAVKILEMSSTLAAMGIRQAEILTRQQYPSLAQTYEELYHHMSDKDYVGRFSLPAVGRFKFILGYEEVLRKAVLTGLHGIRKLVIPRHTEVVVGGHTFTMQYPIEIRVQPHGGIHVVYDGSQPSPLYSLDTNQVEWVVNNHNPERIEMLVLDIPMQQMKLTSLKEPTNRSVLFRKSYAYSDTFFHVRVFNKNSEGNWDELLTTHSGQVFDVNYPTAVIKVLDNEVEVSIPEVYFTTNQISDDVRIDIYTTKGEVELPLMNYPVNEFKISWLDYDSVQNSVYSAPLPTIATLGMYSEQNLVAGSSAMSFERLRERTMYNTLGSMDLPITNVQALHRLEDMQYDLVKNIDNTTNRMFVATRTLPKPLGSDLLTGMGATVGRLYKRLEELVEHPAVYDNGNQITLTPNILYEETGGLYNVVTQVDVDDINAMSLEDRVEHINSRHFLYTPFHYVLDIDNYTFLTRPYYLDNPVIRNKFFVAENGTVSAYVHSDKHYLGVMDGKYVLQVSTDSSEMFKDLPDDEVFVQLRVAPHGESRGGYINGKLVERDDATKERVFEFILDTDYLIDRDHRIQFNNFTMFDEYPTPVRLDLDTHFEILYAVKDHRLPGQRNTEIDQRLGHHILPKDVIGVYHERLSITLGYNLDRLWTRARSSLTDRDYLRHMETVYETYEHNVYERDATGLVLNVVNGKVEFVLLHKAGDPVLDIHGEPVVKHRAGEPVLDEDGNPVIINGREVGREFDVVLFDGNYYFATTPEDINYRDYVPNLIVDWITKDLFTIEQRLLEQTTLHFRPRKTLGLLDVTIGEQVETKYRAEQRITIHLYVTEVTYKNDKLKQVMAKTAIETLSRLMDKPVVTSVEILETIKRSLGTDVISIELQNHGNIGNQPVITINDNAGRLVIGKQLTVLPDGTMAVEDTVGVTFKPHVVA